MFVGALVALALCNADDVIRSDGTRVILKKNPSWISEIVGLYETLRAEPLVIFLFPMFFASNWFYTYQQNGVNSAHFNVRARSLNSFLYWFAQIIAATLMGPLLDFSRVRRSIRARISLGVLFILTMAIWGGGYAWQKTYERGHIEEWDWTHSGYAGPMFLYLFYGFYDALWQGLVYWYMGALGNSGRRLANLAGFYKGLQSTGAAIMWDLDYRKLSLMKEFASNWGLLAGSVLVASPLVFLRIKDHAELDQDLKGTGETVSDVIPDQSDAKDVAEEKRESEV